MKKIKKKTYDTKEINALIKEALNDRLGDLVATEKENQGLSNKEQAKRMNLPQAALSKYINGNSNIQATTLYKLANYYDRSIDFILGRIDYSALDNEQISEITSLTDKAINRLKNITDIKRVDPTLKQKIYMLNYIIENINNSDFLDNLYKYLFARFAFVEGSDLWEARPIRYICCHDVESANIAVTTMMDAVDMSNIFYSKVQQNIHDMKLDIQKKLEKNNNGEHSTKKK